MIKNPQKAKNNVYFKIFSDMYKRKLIKADILHRRIQKFLPLFEKKLEQMLCSEGEYEGKLYRFYHQSFKVYWLQETTKEIVSLLTKINPNKDKKFTSFFEEIIKGGNIGEWKYEHNKEWTKYTRPIVESFFHAKYFLEMVVLCGKEMKGEKKAPKGVIYQRWAALLELYDIR